MNEVERPMLASEPPLNCKRCPRLVALREELQVQEPEWWNAPVPAWGDPNAWLAVLGLAPGKHGANRTGRPFTGDFAGDLLFDTLDKAGLSNGQYDRRADDGLSLDGCIIINGIKCLPPQNKPTTQEAENCRKYLTAQINELKNVHVFIALGKIAHDSFVKHLGLKLSGYKFGHLAEHRLPGGAILIDSYHCSRYNTQTRRLTPDMFEAVFARANSLRAKDVRPGDVVGA